MRARCLIPMSLYSLVSVITLLAITSCQEQVDITKYSLENNPSAQALQASLDTMTLAYEEVTVSGKIIGYKHGRSAEDLEVYINDAIRSDQVFYYNKINSDGTFEVKFQLAHPQDIMIKYQRVFSIFAAPGDSIYFEFNGLTKSRPRLYQTITFGGDHAATNTQLARYWHKYFRQRDLKDLRRAQKHMNLEHYDRYMNKLFEEQQVLRASILDKMESNDTTLLYTHLDIELDLHERYTGYFMRDRKTIDRSSDILTVIESMPTWRKSSMINTKFKHLASNMHLLVPVTEEKLVDDFFEHYLLTHKKALTNQPMLKEIVFNEMLSHAFARYVDLSAHANDISPFIQNPLIAETLNNKLNKVIKHNQDPQVSNKIMLDHISAIDKDEIIQKLKDDHKGKVLYIDFWATYCAPCISEMMVSNDMHDRYADDLVTFVYICLDGKERSDKWDNIVNGKGLKGHHLQLTGSQSNNLMKGIGFTGVPFYMILDQEGNLIEKGSHLRPSSGQSSMAIDKLIET